MGRAVAGRDCRRLGSVGETSGLIGPIPFCHWAALCPRSPYGEEAVTVNGCKFHIVIGPSDAVNVPTSPGVIKTILICLGEDRPNSKHSGWVRPAPFFPALGLENAADKEAPNQSGLR
jgi:hypothetical protein